MRSTLLLCLFAACTVEPTAALDVAGGPRWAISLGGRANDHGTTVAIDSIGDVIVAGDFQGPADLGSGLDTVGGPWPLSSMVVAPTVTTSLGKRESWAASEVLLA